MSAVPGDDVALLQSHGLTTLHLAAAFWLLVRFSLSSVTSVATTTALVLTVTGFEGVALKDMFERACRYSDYLHHVVSLLWSFDRDFKITSSTHTRCSRRRKKFRICASC
jgi:hypothetical protein